MNISRQLIFALVLFSLQFSFAQQPVGNASIETRIATIKNHYQELAYEQALVEVDDMRWYLKREKQAPSPEVISMATLVYKAVNDPKSGMLFLDEALSSERYVRNTVGKVDLIKEIAASYSTLGFPDKAYAAQKNVLTLQNNLLEANQSTIKKQLEHQADSLRTIFSITGPSDSGSFVIAKEKLYLFAGLIGLVFLALIFANFFSSKRYKKELEQKEFEWEVAMNDKLVANNAEISSASASAQLKNNQLEKEALLAPEQEEKAFVAKFNPFEDELEEGKVALIIEPDSHASLYIRMLLNNRFRVESARTPAEAKEMTQTLFPDLIVCDTQLNGTTGTEFIRETKMSERTSHIPVIMLGESTELAALDAERAGAEKSLQRPTPGAALHEQVDQIFETQKLKHAEFQRLLQLWYSTKHFDSSNPFLQTVLQMIEKNLPDPDFTPESLAQKLQYTNIHFYRKIQAMTGKTPSQLVREMRLEKARFLLETGSVPVPIIAQMVGYAHSGTFALAFKNYFGDNSLLISE